MRSTKRRREKSIVKHTHSIRATSESTFLPVRHVQDLRYWLSLLACIRQKRVNTRAAAAAAAAVIAFAKSTKCYNVPAGSFVVMSKYATDDNAQQLFFRTFSNAPKIPCWCLWWERREENGQRIRLYAMIDGEKVLFALWIFRHFRWVFFSFVFHPKSHA